MNKKSGEGLTSPIHPMLNRAFEVLEPMFIESVIPESGHKLLASSEYWEPLLDTLPEAASMVRDRMLQAWSGRAGAELSPAEKWAELKEHLEACFGRNSSVKRSKNVSTADKERCQNWPMEVVFKYTYPRLDINVSKMQNHLLKSPFCVHPKTGRVCVPIEVDKIDDFDPFAVPTLPVLMRELDEYGKNNNDQDGKARKDWQKTSLKGYFEPFQKDFLEPMLKKERRKAREEAEEKAAAMGSF